MCGIVAKHGALIDLVCVHGKWKSGVKHDFLLVNIIFDQKGHYDGGLLQFWPNREDTTKKNGD